MSGRLILPELHRLYEWVFTDHESTADVIISLPAGFSPSSITSMLSPDSASLLVTMKDRVPIVKGTLTAPATGISRKATDTTLVLTLTKADPARWATLIAGFYPGTSDMDPQSAFTLAAIPTWGGDRTRLLMASANVGFCPALRQTFAALAENPRSIGKARELLSVAAFTYGDPLSLYAMGCFLAEDPASQAEAFAAFVRAGDAGIVAAKSRAGQFLSPLSAMRGVPKDVTRAIELFESVREEDPSEPVMCHELAMLYHNGVGVRTDRKLAGRLQAEGMARDPELPPLESTGGGGGKLLLGVAVGTVVGAGLVTLMRLMLRHGK
jgi:hypothetical protein